MKKVILIFMALLIAGCMSVGPLVTHVKSDGKGNLDIEDCMMKYNGFIGYVAISNCQHRTISLTK